MILNKARMLVHSKRLKQDLHNIRENFLDKEQSWITLITGRIGSGKSTLGIQVCKQIDPTFNMSRCCFTPEQFRDALQNNKCKAILYDEAVTGMYSQDFMKTINKDLTKAMIMSRKYANFIVLAIPKLERLTKSVREDLICSWIEVRVTTNQRRYFKHYSQKQLMKILRGDYVRPLYRYTFSKYNPFEAEYDKLKNKSIEGFFKKLGEGGKNGDEVAPEVKRKLEDDIINSMVDKGFTHTQIGKALGYSRVTICTRMSKFVKSKGVKHLNKNVNIITNCSNNNKMESSSDSNIDVIEDLDPRSGRDEKKFKEGINKLSRRAKVK